VAELGSRGTRAIVVITSGFGELGEEGQRLQQAMLDAAKPHTLRLVGPNRPGIMVPEHGFNASFAQAQALSGDLAFVSQSGAVLTSVLDRATARRIGFSHMVSLGGMADVDCGDMLDYLATDRHTRAQGISTNALQASGQTQNTIACFQRFGAANMIAQGGLDRPSRPTLRRPGQTTPTFNADTPEGKGAHPRSPRLS
jgi:acetyltransferase